MLQVYATQGISSDSVVRITNLNDSIASIRSYMEGQLSLVHGRINAIADSSQALNGRVAGIAAKLDSVVAASEESARTPESGEWLHSLVTWVYPVLIIGFLLGLIAWCVVIVFSGGNFDLRVRRSIGAALPGATLVILVNLPQPTTEHPFWDHFVESWIVQFIGGLVTGFAVMLLGRTVAESTEEVWGAISAFIVAGLASFVAYAAMMDAVNSIGVYLLTALFILGGDIMLRGTYTPHTRRRDRAMPGAPGTRGDKL